MASALGALELSQIPPLEALVWLHAQKPNLK